jgi:diguanylate cyclase (GGDEF)-like protein
MMDSLMSISTSMQSLSMLSTYSDSTSSSDFISGMAPLSAMSNSLLLEQLQTTLNIQKLLEIYSMEVAKYIDLAGLSFVNEEFLEKIRGSEPGKKQRQFNIILEGEHLGRINYGTNQVISKNTETTLKSFHKTLAYPLRNALQYKKALQLATQDSLTGLGNRSLFDKTLKKAAMNSSRHHWSIALILIDLNKFKEINDTYGHHTGDQVLIHFSKAINASIRCSDSCFRFGGDEFAIIVENASNDGHEIISKRLIAAVQADELLARYQLGCSIGTAIHKSNESVDELFIRADKQLYRNKQKSRLTII